MNGWLTVLILALAFVQGGFAVVILIGQRGIVRASDRMITALDEHDCAARYRETFARPWLAATEHEHRDDKETP